MPSPTHDSPDGPIIAAVLEGHVDRFEELVDRYEGALLRLARSRLGRRDWAEDAVQETFLCAFKSLAGYDSRFSFRTWLWTILLNQCRRRYQRAMRVPRVDSWSDVPGNEDGNAPRTDPACQGQTSPAASLLARERSQKLDRLLESLPAAQADALRLRFFGGLKFQEIADAMSCSLSSAKNRVRWGLARLAAMLREEEQNHDGQTPRPASSVKPLPTAKT